MRNSRDLMDCVQFTVNVTGACTMHFQRVFRNTYNYNYIDCMLHVQK